MSGNNRYSHTLKVAAVEKFLAGKVKADVLAEFGITSRAVLNNWVAAYRADGVLGLVDKPKGRKPRGKDPSSQSLEERIYHLEMENAVLKKFHALMDEHKPSPASASSKLNSMSISTGLTTIASS